MANLKEMRHFIPIFFIVTQELYPRMKQTFLAVQEEKVSKLTSPLTAMSPQECCKNKKQKLKKEDLPHRIFLTPFSFYSSMYNSLAWKY